MKASDLIYFLIQLEDTYDDPDITIDLDFTLEEGELMYDERDKILIIGSRTA